MRDNHHRSLGITPNFFFSAIIELEDDILEKGSMPLEQPSELVEADGVGRIVVTVIGVAGMAGSRGASRTPTTKNTVIPSRRPFALPSFI